LRRRHCSARSAWNGTSLLIVCCAPLIASSIYPAFVRVRARSTAIPAAPRHGARHRRHRCLCHLAARAEEGRDALRAPEAHPQTRSPAPVRTTRRLRRVPPRSHRPEPQENGEADAGRSTAPGGMRANAPSAPDPSADFFNTIDPLRTFGEAEDGDVDARSSKRWLSGGYLKARRLSAAEFPP
jgi:hypothetical protein